MKSGLFLIVAAVGCSAAAIHQTANAPTGISLGECATSVSGRFDPDDIYDNATLRSSGADVLVELSSSKLGRKILLEVSPNDKLEDYCLAKRVAGVYSTACGEGYVDCLPGGAKVLEIKYDFLEVGRSEAGSSYVYFDKIDQRLIKVTATD